uniref:Ribonuclease A-domain domain-containing protein n=1 Tax=Gopherus evgoodei TaxID=1825980 RepID=A0A8C4Y6M4_9SAUR
MAPKGPRPLLFLTLVLLAACLAQLSEGASYRQFLTRHVDFPKSGGGNNRLYCNRIMQRRGLTRPVCKPTNTFIHAPTSQIEPVCRDGGEPAEGDLRLSEDPFPLTVCELQGGSDPPDCDYSGSSSTSRIVIACVDGEPVHFETQVESQAGEGDEP